MVAENIREKFIGKYGSVVHPQTQRKLFSRVYLAGSAIHPMKRRMKSFWRQEGTRRSAHPCAVILHSGR